MIRPDKLLDCTLFNAQRATKCAVKFYTCKINQAALPIVSFSGQNSQRRSPKSSLSWWPSSLGNGGKTKAGRARGMTQGLRPDLTLILISDVFEGGIWGCFSNSWETGRKSLKKQCSPQLYQTILSLAQRGSQTQLITGNTAGTKSGNISYSKCHFYASVSFHIHLEELKHLQHISLAKNFEIIALQWSLFHHIATVTILHTDP